MVRDAHGLEVTAASAEAVRAFDHNRARVPGPLAAHWNAMTGAAG